MASERQKAANRANAKNSTGPKSPDGKRNAARNARRHGLSGKWATSRETLEARALAEAFCLDDCQLSFQDAVAIAAAVLRLQDVTRIAQEMVQFALQSVDDGVPPELREDLARISILRRLGPLDDYERRAFGSLRKHIRRIK